MEERRSKEKRRDLMLHLCGGGKEREERGQRDVSTKRKTAREDEGRTFLVFDVCEKKEDEGEDSQQEDEKRRGNATRGRGLTLS